jgi:hypothetical protein
VAVTAQKQAVDNVEGPDMFPLAMAGAVAAALIGASALVFLRSGRRMRRLS